MKKKLPYIITAIAIIILDQLTKRYFINFFESGFSQDIILLPILKLVYVWNKGVSFGMLSGFAHSNLIFLWLSSFISIVILYLLLKSKSTLESLSYSLIIGGAVGNIIDRIEYDAVFDFIYFHINEHYWPAFNVADSSVSIGVMLFLLTLVYNKEIKTGKK